MARPKLRKPDQAPWLRVVLGVYEFFASLKLAVILIFTSAVLLAIGTMVESKYGSYAVRFLVYDTWWFAGLHVLLAINIFCAASIRFPWKRHQTGFVVTHIGLLTLLYGCLLSRIGGVDAQMSVFETQAEQIAYERDAFFEIEVASRGGDGQLGAPTRLPPIPFDGGPFHWRELSEQAPVYPWFLRRFLRPPVDRGVLYDQDGIRLEVIDYLADAVETPVPRVRLRAAAYMKADLEKQRGDEESEVQPVSAESIEFMADSLEGALSRRELPRNRVARGALTFCLWRTEDAAETSAFLEGLPEGDLGAKGQVVLRCQGETYRFQVDEAVDQGRLKAGDSGLEIEISKYELKPRWDRTSEERDMPTVVVQLYHGDDPPHLCVLTADHPEIARHARSMGAYLSYWFDYGARDATERMAGKARSRFDVVQGHGEEKLYYRFWRGPNVTSVGELPVAADAVNQTADDPEAVDAFDMNARMTMRIAVERFDPYRGEERDVVPVPYNRDMTPQSASRAALVKLKVDDVEREFWVGGPSPYAKFGFLPSFRESEKVVGKRRIATVRMPLREIDVGLRVRLDNFERRLDPGTSQASHYSSFVDFLDTDSGEKLNRGEPVMITMNAPVDVTDPRSGRSLRLYQEGFQPGDGIWGPDSPQYLKYIDPTSDRSEIYLSTLTVNYDPGRFWKYAGCLLIVGGIATMFYMRAYFFKPQRRDVKNENRGKPKPVEALAAVD